MSCCLRSDRRTQMSSFKLASKTAPLSVNAPPSKEAKYTPPKSDKGRRERASVNKTTRVVVRKLPYKDFSKDDFEKCIDRLCSVQELGLRRECFYVEHFVTGKIR